MADPPWTYKNWSIKGVGKGAAGKYCCMRLEDIAMLPVARLATKDCMLFLWATWPLVREALQVLDAWGFAYASGGAWHKTTRNGVTAFGTGYRVRSASEPFLLGTRGNPRNSRSERNIIVGEAREHSRKPEEAYSWCERWIPEARRVELFARQMRPGWAAYGDELGKFA
jgi:N6-adenosine-specific RNA methylase IME4